MFLAFLLIFDFLPDLSEDVSRDIIGHVLSVYREHPDLITPDPGEIDYPDTTSFSPSSRSPSKLSNSA